ncbi:hypothetical protein HOC01_01155 [archaeon]|jgi:hypothetical protein|nr:hypothetical protein [archaeon]MBT6698072.1 hypothetical protein [archaeon]
MNKTILSVLALVLILISSALVTADVGLTTDVSVAFEIDQGTLVDDEEEITIDIALAFTESASINESEVNFSVSSSSSLFDVEILSTEADTRDIEADASETVTLELTADLSSGLDSGLYEDLITVTWVDSTGTNSATLDLDILTMLEINEAYLHIDDDEEEKIDESDATDDNVDLTVAPGDKISIYFNLINLFDEDYDNGELEVEVTAEMDDDDWTDDIDEDFDVDIEADEEIDDGDDEYVIEFNVPLEAESNDDYELVVTFEAEDENGAAYTNEWIIVLEVERDDDDVRIDSVDFATTARCDEAPRLVVKVSNYGEDAQDDMYVHVSQEDLDISETSALFDIEEGTDEDDNEVTVNYYIDMPNSAEETSYELEANLYYDDGDLADRLLFNFDLSCEDTSSSSDDSSSDSDDSDEQEDSSSTVIVLSSDDLSDNSDSESTSSESSEDRVVTVEKSYTIKDTQLGLTIVLIVLVVLALIALLVVGLRRK